MLQQEALTGRVLQSKDCWSFAWTLTLESPEDLQFNVLSIEPRLFASGQSNSAIKLCNQSATPQDNQTLSLTKSQFKTLCHNYIGTFSRVTAQRHCLRKRNAKRTCIHKHQTNKNRRGSPFSTTPVKRAHKAITCRYHRPFMVLKLNTIRQKKSS